MPHGVTQDGQVRVKSSDKTWSTGGGIDNTLQYPCHRTPMDHVRRQNYMQLEDEPSRLEDVQYATGEEWGANVNSSRKSEVAEQKKK